MTSLIAIIGALLLALTLFSHGHFHASEEIERMISALQVMYVISIITLLLAITGVYGACKEKQWALILFAVGMILSSLFLISSAIRALVLQPQLAEDVRKQYLSVLPLENASDSFLEHLQYTQMELQCCGLESYKDWGHNISVTCLCNEDSINPCMPISEQSIDLVSESSIMIYKEPCLPFVIKQIGRIVNTSLGILLGITLLLVLSAVLCIVILCQLRRKCDTPAVVYSAEAKAGNYTTLTDPAEYT